MTKTGIHKGGRYCWHSSERNMAKVIKSAKDENFETIIQRYQDSQDILIPILETRGLATAPRSFSRMAELDLKPGQLILKHNNGP